MADLKIRKLQLEIQKARAVTGSESNSYCRQCDVELCRMDKWIKPHKVGEHIALFLIQV